jgi:hypothetical protein
MIDLIFDPAGGPIDDDWLGRAESIEVFATMMPLASLEDVLVTKLMALDEQWLDYSSVLETARSVREQIDWKRFTHVRTTPRTPPPSSRSSSGSA